MIGFISGTYSQFGGQGPTGGATGNVLNDASNGPLLAFTPNSNFVAQSFTATIDQDYEAIGVVFRGDCFDSPLTNCANLRGVDNVVLEGPSDEVPAPASLGLLGLGIAGLALVRRRRKTA